LRVETLSPIAVVPPCNDSFDVGMGSVVVLLHSSLSTKRQWQVLSERLAHSHRCIVFDLMGYGNAMHPPDRARFSVAEEVARIRARLAMLISSRTAIHVVGHSYGGAVALRLAQELQSQTRSLTLFEPVAFHLLRATYVAVAIIRIVAECVEREVTNVLTKAKRRERCDRTKAVTSDTNVC
jgi:pimeloyl-ACP methyl ester carboxylesterase